MSDLQVNMLEHRIKITYICPSLAEYGSNMDMAVEKCITYLDMTTFQLLDQFHCHLCKKKPAQVSF